MPETYAVPLTDFPHTIGQAGVVLGVALGGRRSAVIAEFAGLTLRSVQQTLGLMVRLGLVKHLERFECTGRCSEWVAIRPDLWRWVMLVPAVQILVSRGFDRGKLAAISCQRSGG